MSDADKQARLAKALRANLRKRKAQARAANGPSASGKRSERSSGADEAAAGDDAPDAISASDD